MPTTPVVPPVIDLINLGEKINDGNGDSLRVAFNKCNNNFELLGNGFQSDLLELQISHEIAPPVNKENGTLWFDPVNGALKVWNTAADYWYVLVDDPSTGPVIISGTIPVGSVEGDLWLDTNTNELKLYTLGSGWTVFMSIVSTTQASPVHVGTLPPASAIQGDLWFKTDLIPPQMYVYNSVGVWEQVSDTEMRPVTVSVFEPPIASTKIGDLWYDLSLSLPLLKLYDGNSWIQTTYVNSASDIVKISPSPPSPLEYGTIWYDIINETIKIFDGSGWRVQQSVVSDADKGNKISYSEVEVDPTEKKKGDLWYVPSSNKMRIYSGAAWETCAGTTTYVSGTAPAPVLLGDEWYDPQKLRSNIWDGANWLDATGAKTFLSPTPPVNYMELGDLYFNLHTNKLFVYEDSSIGWTDVSGSRTTVTPVISPPTDPVVGDFWYVSDHYRLKVYTGVSWQEVNEKTYITPNNPTHAIVGDFWVNTGLGNQLSVKNGPNATDWLLVGGSSSSGNIVTVQSGINVGAPSSILSNQGDLWFDTDVAEMFIFYDDGSSVQWVTANGSTSTNSLGGTTVNRPLVPTLYQQYFDTTINKMIIWTGSDWSDFIGNIV